MRRSWLSWFAAWLLDQELLVALGPHRGVTRRGIAGNDLIRWFGRGEQHWTGQYRRRAWGHHPMPNSHNNLADRPEHDDGRLDVPAQVERSWSGVGLAAGPLTVRAKVRVVTGGRARAVAAAQGRALIALLKAAVPRVDTDDEEEEAG